MTGLYLGSSQVKKVYVGSTEAKSLYLGSTKIWSAAPSIGDSYMGGYYAGIIDTTVGNIIAADASQTGARYALIVAGADLESAQLQYKTSQTAAPPAASTRWDGLTATTSMNSADYPAAQYCAGLPYDSDGASAWYLPAMDELELIYRNLKPTTASNGVYKRTGSTFPGTSHVSGYNPSSDPAGVAYTASNPAETDVTAFQSGGAQALDTASSTGYWTATEYDPVTYAWIQSFIGSLAGNQSTGYKNSSFAVRPVRRLVLS